METGRAVAEANDDILLAAQVANSKDPAQFEISKEPLSVEPYGIMMRKGDPAFKKVVDAAIVKVYQSGQITPHLQQVVPVADPAEEHQHEFPDAGATEGGVRAPDRFGRSGGLRSSEVNRAP